MFSRKDAAWPLEIREALAKQAFADLSRRLKRIGVVLTINVEEQNGDQSSLTLPLDGDRQEWTLNVEDHQ